MHGAQKHAGTRDSAQFPSKNRGRRHGEQRKRESFRARKRRRRAIEHPWVTVKTAQGYSTAIYVWSSSRSGTPLNRCFWKKLFIIHSRPSINIVRRSIVGFMFKKHIFDKSRFTGVIAAITKVSATSENAVKRRLLGPWGRQRAVKRRERTEIGGLKSEIAGGKSRACAVSLFTSLRSVRPSRRLQQKQQRTLAHQAGDKWNAIRHLDRMRRHWEGRLTTVSSFWLNDFQVIRYDSILSTVIWGRASREFLTA